MKLLKSFFLILTLSCSIEGFCQNENAVLDSLLNELKTAKEDTIKVDILDNIIWEYLSSDLDKALKYANEELELAKKLKFQKGISSGLTSLGNVYNRKGDYNLALKFHLEGLELNEKAKNNRGIINSYINIGIVYQDLRDYKTALDYFFKSLEISQKHLDSSNIKNKYTIAAIYGNIGSTQFYLKEYSEALRNQINGLNIMRSINDKRSMSGLYNNIGVTYSNLKQYDQALESYQESLKLAKEINSAEDEIYTTISIGRLYKSINKHDIAISYFEKVLQNPFLIDSKILRLNLYQMLAESYEQLKDFKNQGFYLSKYIALNDSVFSEEKLTELATLQTKFKTEEKEKENIILTNEIKLKELQLTNKQYLLFGLISLLILAIGSGVLIVRQNKLKAKQQSMQLEQKLLRSQMNPHFIFNSLQAIQNFIKEKDAIKYLSSFGALTRSVLENSRLESISLKKEIALINHYLELQKLLHEDQFNYVITISPEIDTECISIPPMLSQPFIENAIEHGMRDIENGGLIEISFSENNDTLFLEIKDNGKGLSPIQNEKHHSFATEITKERISLFNKGKSRKANFTIGEAYPNEIRKGVKVNFSLPI